MDMALEKRLVNTWFCRDNPLKVLPAARLSQTPEAPSCCSFCLCEVK